jgi:hypothetical protein
MRKANIDLFWCLINLWIALQQFQKVSHWLREVDFIIIVDV